ncbi:ABC transporter permease [Thermococcus sp.]|uniref:ABC transporter permease n=1 Tax=Thermococcus sp. TaxID=35749 RepID=UPI0026048BF9|nr:ABC transporter permease [Thermococcus sp.]
MSDFWVLAKKELKNFFRDKKLLFGLVVVPLVLLPVLGHAFTMGLEQAKGTTHVAVANFDNGKYGRLLISVLRNSPNVSVVVVNASNVEEAISEALRLNQNVLVVIPPDFSKRLESNETATVELYGIFTTISTGMKESVSAGRISAILNVLSEGIAEIKVKNLGAKNPNAVLHPIVLKSESVINGRVVDVSPAIVSSIIVSQAMTIPLVVFMMVMVTSQMAAGAIASEKENKTLETLLTLPVPRTYIVASKIFGTAVMGLVAAVAYMIGMKYYMASFNTGTTGVSLQQLGLTVTPLGGMLFALAVFLTIIIALSLAMIVAVFAEDVQSATTLVSAVIMPLAFPAFLLMYTDINALSPVARYALLAIPFTHPIIDYRHVLMGSYRPVVFSVVYLLIVALATLYATAWLFSTEKILTAQIKWGRRKRI